MARNIGASLHAWFEAGMGIEQICMKGFNMARTGKRQTVSNVLIDLSELRMLHVTIRSRMFMRNRGS